MNSHRYLWLSHEALKDITGLPEDDLYIYGLSMGVMDIDKMPIIFICSDKGGCAI